MGAEVDVFEEIIGEPERFARRLDARIDGGLPEPAIQGWIDFVEEMARENYGYNLKPFLDTQREHVRRRFEGRGGAGM